MEQHWGPDDPIRFRHFTFERLMAFLQLLTELDLVNLNRRRIALRDATGQDLDAETGAKVREILKHKDGVAIIDESLRNGSITSRDLVNVGYRKDQLAVFEELLSGPEALTEYRAKHEIASSQPEKIWQHFFEKNEWIFGYGLDYRFFSIMISARRRLEKPTGRTRYAHRGLSHGRVQFHGPGRTKNASHSPLRKAKEPGRVGSYLATLSMPSGKSSSRRRAGRFTRKRQLSPTTAAGT